MEELKERRDCSAFSREFRLIGDRLVSTGKVWFKSQGIIFLLTSFLCTIGMFLVGNPCPVLVGMGIGIMDAFPVLGQERCWCRGRSLRLLWEAGKQH